MQVALERTKKYHELSKNTLNLVIWNSPFDPSEACPPEWGLAGSRHRWSSSEGRNLCCRDQATQGLELRKVSRLVCTDSQWYNPFQNLFRLQPVQSSKTYIGYWYLFIVFKQMIWYAHGNWMKLIQSEFCDPRGTWKLSRPGIVTLNCELGDISPKKN